MHIETATGQCGRRGGPGEGRRNAGMINFLYFMHLEELAIVLLKKIHTSPACLAVRAFQNCQGGCQLLWIVRVDVLKKCFFSRANFFCKLNVTYREEEK